MANPIIIFWKWLNPFQSKNKRKSWDEKRKVALLKTLIICALLVPVVVLYVKYNEVSILRTNIAMYQIYGDIPLESEITVCYDFGRSKDLKIDQQPGVELTLNIPERYYKAVFNNYEPAFSEKTIDKIKKDVYNPLVLFSGQEVLRLNNILKKDYSKTDVYWDSIRSIYKITIEHTAIFPFKPFILDGTPDSCDISSNTINGYVSSSLFMEPLVTNNDTVSTNLYYLSNGEWNAMSKQGGITGSSFRYYRNILIDARDISRSVEIFRTYGNREMKKLRFLFLGSTEFSAIYPNPDIINVNSIEYDTPDKLDIIYEQGLTFHTKFPDMENKQQARTFAITTVLTLLITLLFKYLYIITVDFWRGVYTKHKKVFYILFVITILLPILYVLISLFFPIIYHH